MSKHKRNNGSRFTVITEMDSRSPMETNAKQQDFAPSTKATNGQNLKIIARSNGQHIIDKESSSNVGKVNELYMVGLGVEFNPKQLIEKPIMAKTSEPKRRSVNQHSGNFILSPASPQPKSKHGPQPKSKSSLSKPSNTLTSVHSTGKNHAMSKSNSGALGITQNASSSSVQPKAPNKAKENTNSIDTSEVTTGLSSIQKAKEINLNSAPMDLGEEISHPSS